MHHAQKHPALRPRSRRAFSMLETMFAVVVMTIGVLTVAASMIGGLALGAQNHETLLAEQAMRATIETMQSTAFERIHATFDADPKNDPNGAGTAPGATFAVPGLGLQPGDPDGRVGSILFPTDPLGGGVREDAVDANWGLPFDLNGDGKLDALDHAGDYRLLPVHVRLDWRGSGGNRRVEMWTVLTDR